jgi:TatD family-associated radical SAM protein
MSPIHDASSIVYWLGENLYLNITNRCSNNCYFCFRKYKNGIGKFNLKLTAEPSTDDVIKQIKSVLSKKQWSEVVFCGFGEPLTRLDTVLDVTEHLKTVSTVPIRINTNGQACLINKDRDVIDELKEAGVDKLSVSLPAHNKETYDSVCKPKLENAFDSVLEFIGKASALINTEITTVTIPEVNISEMEALARKLRVKLRVRQYEQFFW